MANCVEQAAEQSRSASSRRKNDPAGMRTRILDAAFSLFQSQGYAGTSVHEIATAAGVTGGALHHHFPTKKALGLAVIRDPVGTALEMTWLEPVRSTATARAGILNVLESLASELDGQGTVRGCPVNNLTLELALADADFRTELRRLFDRWRSTVSERLADRPDGEALAALVVAAYSGAMALAKVEQRGEPLRLCARQLAPLL